MFTSIFAERLDASCCFFIRIFFLKCSIDIEHQIVNFNFYLSTSNISTLKTSSQIVQSTFCPFQNIANQPLLEVTHVTNWPML